MNKKIWLSIFLGMTIVCCNNICQDKGLTGTDEQNGAGQDTLNEKIPVDSANKMIGSYLASINYQQNDTDLKSISIDAKLLRRYLLCGKKSKDVAFVKIMFAHNLDYINSGHANQPAGYKSGALTLVIAAYDANGTYILLPNNSAIDHGMSCPNNCPAGEAGSPLITTTNSRE